MTPAIALRGIDELVGLVEVGDGPQVEVLGVRGPDECRGLLVDQVPRLPSVCVDLDHAKALMSAVDLFVGEATAVLAPAQMRFVIVDAIDGGLRLFLAGNVEQVQFERRELVAR